MNKSVPIHYSSSIVDESLHYPSFLRLKIFYIPFSKNLDFIELLPIVKPSCPT